MTAERDVTGETTLASQSNAAAGDRFGTAVSVHDQVMVVGAPHHDDERGAAYFYGQPYNRGHQTEWNQVAIVTAASAPGGRQLGDRFGRSVDNYRGNVIVGAPLRDLNTFGALEKSNAGAAFIFRPRITNSFAPYRVYAGFGAGDRQENDRFGRGVAIGSLFWLIGAPRADIGAGIQPIQINPGTGILLNHTDRGAIRRGPYRTLNWYW